MNHVMLIGGLCLAAGMLGCSAKSVELTEPPSLEPSSGPTTLGAINEQIDGLVVDEARLYWVGVFSDTRSIDGRIGAALHSCLKDRCSDSLLTYGDSSISVRTGFGLHGGEIIWTAVSPTGFGAQRILACPVAGCNGEPRAVLDLDISDYWLDPQFADDAIYLVDGNAALYSVPYTGAAKPQLVRGKLNTEYQFAINGGYLYWLEGDANGDELTIARSLLSVPDGREVVTRGLRITPNYARSYDTFGTLPLFEFDSTHLYWAESTLTGSLRRCPLSGCVGDPEVLIEPIQAPRTPVVDGPRLYFQYQDTQLGNSLSGCDIDDCELSPPIASGLDAWAVIAVDDRYVYTATTDAVLNPDKSWDFPSARLRRFAK